MDLLNAFRGRESELQQLDALLAAAVAGRAQLAVIAGERGIGKSALLGFFAREYVWKRSRIRAQLIRHEDDLEYDPLRIAARELQGRFAGATLASGYHRLIPDWLGAVPVVGNVLSAAVATVAAIRRRRGSGIAAVSDDCMRILKAARARPVVLLIDDLERVGDEAMSQLVVLMQNAAGGCRLLVVAAHTPEPHSPVNGLTDVLCDTDIAELQLGPLARADVHELIMLHVRGRELSVEARDRICDSTGGHPLLLASALAAADDRAPDAAAVDLTALDPAVRRLLTAAAAIGPQFDSVTLAADAGLDELTVEDLLDVAVRSGMLVSEGEVSHDSGETATAYRFASLLLRAALHQRALELDGPLERG